MRTQSKAAFNGLVVFDVTYITPLSNLTVLSILDAVPEHKTWTERVHLPIKNALYTLAQRLPITANISFPDVDLPDELEGLREFWNFAKGNTDYRAVWEKYASLVSDQVGEAWWDATYKDTRLAAPKELQVSDKEAASDPN